MFTWTLRNRNSGRPTLRRPFLNSASWISWSTMPVSPAWRPRDRKMPRSTVQARIHRPHNGREQQGCVPGNPRRNSRDARGGRRLNYKHLLYCGYSGISAGQRTLRGLLCIQGVSSPDHQVDRGTAWSGGHPLQLGASRVHRNRDDPALAGAARWPRMGYCDGPVKAYWHGG